MIFLLFCSGELGNEKVILKVITPPPRPRKVSKGMATDNGKSLASSSIFCYLIIQHSAANK